MRVIFNHLSIKLWPITVHQATLKKIMSNESPQHTRFSFVGTKETVSSLVWY